MTPGSQVEGPGSWVLSPTFPVCQSCSQKFHNNHGIDLKINNHLEACSFIKKRLQLRCFPVNIARFLRPPILKNFCEQLLLFSQSLSWNLYNSLNLYNSFTTEVPISRNQSIDLQRCRISSIDVFLLSQNSFSFKKMYEWGGERVGGRWRVIMGSLTFQRKSTKSWILRGFFS